MSETGVRPPRLDHDVALCAGISDEQARAVRRHRRRSASVTAGRRPAPFDAAVDATATRCCACHVTCSTSVSAIAIACGVPLPITIGGLPDGTTAEADALAYEGIRHDPDHHVPRGRTHLEPGRGVEKTDALTPRRLQDCMTSCAAWARPRFGKRCARDTTTTSRGMRTKRRTSSGSGSRRYGPATTSLAQSISARLTSFAALGCCATWR